MTEPSAGARSKSFVDELGYAVVDADNHYYEAADAFTRYLDPALAPRCVEWVEIDGRRAHVVGGRAHGTIVKSAFDSVGTPGTLYEYLRRNPDGRPPGEFLSHNESVRTEYQDRDARLAVMDDFGVEATWLFPTLGVFYEELLEDDPTAVTATYGAFNRWLEEDWGFDYRKRIHAVPHLSLCDVEWSCRQLEWALDRGARLVSLRPAVVHLGHELCSPDDARFDPLWARVNEAGITVAVHAGDSGSPRHGYARIERGTRPSERWTSSIEVTDINRILGAFHVERAAFDFLFMIGSGTLFDRFPGLRIISVENGSRFIADLFSAFRAFEHARRGSFSHDLVERFRRHVWINPFWEDDAHALIDLMGSDRVVFGSDWPHMEGLPRPVEYLDELGAIDAAARRRIFRDNALELMLPRRVACL